jgi:hypothetical protein
MKRRCCSALLILCACSARAETEKYDCASAAGWALTDLKGGVPAGAKMAPSNGAMVIQYQRPTLTPIVHTALLTEFQELRLTIHSQHAGTFAILIKDRDGAVFNKPFELPAQKDTQLRFRAQDFQLNEDSPVDKEALDAHKAGVGFVLMDMGAFSGAKGENTLTIRDISVDRPDLAVEKGDLVVTGRTRIDRSIAREGNIVVKDGGYLKIKAQRFVLKGDIIIEDGVIEFDGGIMLIPQRFNHERRMTLQKKGLLIFRNATVATVFPLAMKLTTRAALELTRTECIGGLSCDVDESSKVTLKEAKTPGEFIIAPGATISIADSESMFLWLPAGPNLTGKLALPAGNRVASWKGDFGINVQIANSSNVVWCLLSTPGATGSIEGSEIYGAGVYFGGETSVTLKDVKNNMPLADYSLPAADRKLNFKNSKVRAWNFYANEKAVLNLADCVFGEAFAFGASKISAAKSVCDGTGGYVCAHDSSEISLTDCKITSLVVAKDKASIILTNCEITGEVRATGTAKITLKNCKTSGKVEHDPTATVTRE